MLFFSLASLVFSEIGNYTLKPSTTLLFFTSFGFTDNSKFTFSIHSSIPIRINIFLLSNYEVRNSVSRHVYKTCYSHRVKISNLNQTFNISNNFFWSGTVKNQDVYFPVILICSDNFSILDVSYRFKNKDTLIDFRNEKNSFIYLCFSIINIVLGFFWLVNTYVKTNFSIPLQHIISLLPIFKALSDALLASEWETRKFTDNISRTNKFFSSLFSAMFYIFFMYSTTLVFSGWCIFRMKLGLIENAQIFISSFLVVSGFYINDFIDIYISSLVPILLTSVGFLWYMKLNATYLATLIQLSESHVENERMISRIKLVQHFCVALFSSLILIIILQSGTVSFDFWPIVGTATQEAGLIFFEVVEIYFFFLREKFNGEIDLKSNQKIYAVFLTEPNQKEVAFISQDNDEKCSL